MAGVVGTVNTGADVVKAARAMGALYGVVTTDGELTTGVVAGNNCRNCGFCIITC